MSRDRATLRRYVRYQLPGYGVAVLLAVIAWQVGVPAWIGAAGVALWVLKDIPLWYLVGPSYATGPAPGSTLAGKRGVVITPLAPEGYVRIAGEMWRARTADGRTLGEGTAVTVTHVDGLLVTVEPR